MNQIHEDNFTWESILQELPVSEYNQAKKELPETLGIAQRTWREQKRKKLNISIQPANTIELLEWLFKNTSINKTAITEALMAEIKSQLNLEI